MTDTYWNGEPCDAVRGTGVVLDPSPNFPLFWGKALIGQRVPVVRVRYGRQEFYLYNEGDHGWIKVTDGKGLPHVGHSELGVEKFIPDEVG